MNLKPLYDRIVVAPIIQATTTKSGLALPESSTVQKSQIGTVLAVGDGYLQTTQVTPLKVKVGDTVVFSKSNIPVSGEFVLDDVKVLIMRESDILAVLEK